MLFKRTKRTQKAKRKIPKTVQQSIPVDVIYKDGIIQSGRIFSKTWRFSDINYEVASNAEQEEMFLAHSAILNGLPTDATAKISIFNRKIQNNAIEKIIVPVSDEKYKKYILKKMHANKILDINFRDKSKYGYKYSMMTIKTDNR